MSSSETMFLNMWSTETLQENCKKGKVCVSFYKMLLLVLNVTFPKPLSDDCNDTIFLQTCIELESSAKLLQRKFAPIMCSICIGMYVRMFICQSVCMSLFFFLFLFYVCVCV